MNELVVQTKEALSNLTTSKLRTMLAILGILIGTASVVAMVTSGQMATQKALAEFKTLGTNLMSISLFTSARFEDTQKQKIKLDEFYQLQKRMPDIQHIAPYTNVFIPIFFKENKIEATTIGVTQELQSILKIAMLKGRFISNYDHYESYCVIGDQIYQQIKKTGVINPVGKQIDIGSHVFTIIGVAKSWPENSFFSQSIDRSVIIPIQSSFTLSSYTNINNAVISLKQQNPIKKIENNIRMFFKIGRPQLNIYIRSAKQIIESMEKQSKIYTLLLGLIGSISLIVGGIGVMNIMLVSVSERKKEIGIRMAIGARRRDIRLLFLTEAVILSIFGGLIGILTGLMISFLIAYFANWDFQLFFLPPFVGFLVSAATGIFFGYYPAHLGSKLDPIQTLRSD